MKLILKRHNLRFADISPRGRMHLKDMSRAPELRYRHHMTLCRLNIPTQQFRTERDWNLEDMCTKCLHRLYEDYPAEWYSIEDGKV
jgi:hypothetical protein